MAAATLHGVPAAPGVAIGPARPLHAPAATVVATGDPAAERDSARTALAAAGAALEAVAARLRAEGRTDEADMVEAGALLGADPALEDAVDVAIADGLPAAAAIARAAEAHAVLIAALPDEHLAARAGDVRSFGRRAAALAAGDASAPAAPPAGAVLVADDLGPADVAELDGVAALALARGGPTAHAAIVARSLGLPLVVGLGQAALAVAAGETVIVDGAAGSLTVAPDPAAAARARERMEAVAARRRAAEARRALPATTRDGREVRVLGNAAGAPEVRAALAAGADGIGLLRTELAFLEADAWPTEAQHARLLDAVTAALDDPRRTLTVRLLDFGGDKVPPFLRGVPERGIALLLAHPDALRAQLRALAPLAGRAGLRVLLPLVASPAQVDAVRAELPAGVAVGAMVETPEAAARAQRLAQHSAFLSIGTNDLAHATLGTERFAGGRAPAHHPRVLAEIARTARAARAVGVPLEVCGEAASDPVALPLLVGLGVDELSAGAARVGAVRDAVRALDFSAAQALARDALEQPGADAVAALVRDRVGGLLDESGDEGAERLDRRGRVGAVGV
jgi:phosphoenolpyruvate-protein kinase (PTS system EI component)